MKRGIEEKAHLHLQINSVTIPDKATASVVQSPTFWNFAIIVETLFVGPGRAVLGRVAFAVVLSRLPSCIVHDGPLDCSTFFMLLLS